MEASKLKNMVVLKNLPSNIIDEAIIILKPNKKIKNFELVENSKKPKIENCNKDNKDYILKEAEMLVANYMSRMEKEKVKATSKNVFKEKYNRQKRYSLFATVILFVSLIINFF